MSQLALPLMGTLPEEFDAAHIIHPTIDRARGTCRLPWGKELALDPFFGVIATAPPPHWGRCSSMQPRKFSSGSLSRRRYCWSSLLAK